MLTGAPRTGAQPLACVALRENGRQLEGDLREPGAIEEVCATRARQLPDILPRQGPAAI